MKLSSLKALFVGSGGVRAGWRCLAFLAICYVLGFPLGWFMGALHVPDSWFIPLGPAQILVGELSTGVLVLIATGILAWFERRSILSYGFSPSPSSLPRFLQGLGLGVASAGIVAVLMIAFGGMQIHGFNLHGTQWVRYPVEWAIATLVVGLSEEATFRGYLLVALRRGVGFWPAAIVLSLLFVYAHASKPSENIVDFASLFLLGLWGCFTFWKTGSLWLIVGFHAAFDYMQIFAIGTPNGAQKPIGALLNATFHGQAWVNGGPLGTEASYSIFPLIALLFIYIAWRIPRRSISHDTQQSDMADLCGIFRAGITRGEWGHLRSYGSPTPRLAAVPICANENERLHRLPSQGTPGPRQALFGGHASERARLNGPGSSIRLRSRQWHSNVLSKRHIFSLGRFVLPSKKWPTQTDGYGRKARRADDFRQSEAVISPAH